MPKAGWLRQPALAVAGFSFLYTSMAGYQRSHSFTIRNLSKATENEISNVVKYNENMKKIM